VAKYARATRVQIRITSNARDLRLEIFDDGVGGADPARGSGLRGLADRVDTLGGSLTIESAPGRGRLSRPLRPVKAEAGAVPSQTTSCRCGILPERLRHAESTPSSASPLDP
jgi:signal transduction histidine kinase